MKVQRQKIEPVSCYGSPYFVFVEVCDKLFPNIPKSTIKSRMRNLGLKLLKAPQEVQDKLKTSRPYLACYKVLSLISKREVAVLEAYQDSREERRENSRKLYGPFLTNASVNDSSSYTRGEDQSGEDVFLRDNVQPIMPPKKHELSTNFLVENLLNACPTSLAVEKSLPRTEFSDSQEQIVQEEISSDWEPELSDSSASDSTFSESSSGEEESVEEHEDIVELFKKKDLDISAFPSVVKRLSEMKEFFQSDFNSKRRQSKISDMTWAKTLERLMIFLAYCSRTLKRDIRLELVENMDIVESFIKHIKKKRRVKNNTAANYVMCFIKTAKFLHANESRSNYDAVESISDLRALQNQLMREHAVLESTKLPEKRRLFWPQLQELTRSLHQQFEDEVDLQQKARLHMNFTLLLLFAINPGRAKEFRTLRIAAEIPENEVDEIVRKLPNGENFMLFTKSGATRLVEKGYKTVKKYGPNVIEISEFHFVDFHLKRYVERSRLKLIPRGCVHDFFFVNKRGSPFKTPGSFSSYLAKIFRENLGFHCTMNEMRHALVENFRSSKDSSDVQLAESLARVCKHSLRTQIQVYDRRSQHERTKRALHYLNQSAVSSIMDETEGTSYHAEEEVEDLSGDESDPPAIGEICALIPADARATSPEIFLAKVLKYNSDGQTVRLAWLQQIEGRPNHYKFQVGHSVWEEKVSSLIYPLDVSYNRDEGNYELRSPKKEIYQQLRSAVSV